MAPSLIGETNWWKKLSINILIVNACMHACACVFACMCAHAQTHFKKTSLSNSLNIVEHDYSFHVQDIWHFFCKLEVAMDSLSVGWPAVFPLILLLEQAIREEAID